MFFGPTVTVKAQIKESQKDLRRQIRNIERGTRKHTKDVEKWKTHIKYLAKQGKIDEAKQIAKKVKLTNASIKQFNGLQMQLQTISNKLEIMQISSSMTTAMKSATRALCIMNRQASIPILRNIMMQFEKQGLTMEMQTEMMDGMIDGMNEDADSDEEFFNEILDEVGVEISNGMKLPVSIARHGLNADNLEKTSGRDTIYMDRSGVAHSDENNNNNNNNNSSNKKGKDSSSSLDASLQERLDKLRK